MSHKNKLHLIGAIVLITIFSAGCKIRKQQLIEYDSLHSKQFQYIPKLLHETYLGMPYSQFGKAKFVLPMQDSSVSDFRISFTEMIEDNDIRKVTYYFDKDKSQPLYEYIIEYNSIEKLQELIRQKLGKPNDGSQWIFDSGEGFMISIWTFEKTLCIAGLIEGTEWDR